MSASMLFGVPTRLSPDERHRLCRVISRNWTALMGKPPEDLTSDLDEMRAIFGYGVSAKSIKSKIYTLGEADAETRKLPAEVAIVVDGCALITPEGRILLDVLLDAQRESRTEIGLDAQLSALEAASALRSRWHATWIGKQFDSSISYPVLGAALFLLINGSIGEQRALEMPSDRDRDRELGSVVMPLIAAFSKSLGGREPAHDEGLRQHWAFTQVSRLLGRDVERVRSEHGTDTYIRVGREANLLSGLASRLADTDPARRHRAVSGFVDDYRSARGSLAALGLMHEDPTRTRRIVERLTDPAGAW